MTNSNKRQSILIVDDDKAFASIIAAQANSMGIVTIQHFLQKSNDFC